MLGWSPYYKKQKSMYNQTEIIVHNVKLKNIDNIKLSLRDFLLLNSLEKKNMFVKSV